MVKNISYLYIYIYIYIHTHAHTQDLNQIRSHLEYIHWQYHNIYNIYNICCEHGRGLKSKHGRSLKCCQKNTCEGVHLVKNLLAISLQALYAHNFTICDIIWGEVLFDLYILQWKFSWQKWGRERGARESRNLSRICLIYCLFLWMWEGVAKLIIFCRCHKRMTPSITFIISSAFPRKICRLHLRNFWNKIPSLIRACFWRLNAEAKVQY